MDDMMKFELEDDLFWEAKTHLPSWKGFQNRSGAYGDRETEAPSDGTVTIRFAPEGRDTAPLNDDELASVKWFIDHEASISAAFLSTLFARYQTMQREAGYTRAEMKKCMPHVDSVEAFKKLIGLHTVNIHPLTKNRIPYIGFEFGCEWDEEHGLGAMMHGNQLVKMGGADTAIHLWIAQRHAGG